MAVLKDILELVAETKDGIGDMQGLRINEIYDVYISFMSEEETWIKIYPEHPILIPFYECEVEGLTVHSGLIQIWLKYEQFLEPYINKDLPE